jgi:hypothetical protein
VTEFLGQPALTLFLEQRRDRSLDLAVIKRVSLGQSTLKDEFHDQALDGPIGEPKSMVAAAIPVLRADLALANGRRRA